MTFFAAVRLPAGKQSRISKHKRPSPMDVTLNPQTNGADGLKPQENRSASSCV
jgi:hypothetical protein